MADTRTVTGTILSESGAAWASQSVIFELMTPLATTTDDTVLQKTYTLTTDESGDFSATLAVPDSGAWQYQCTLPNGKFIFNLEAGAATTLHDILADLNLSATVNAATLANYVHISNVLDEDDFASDSAVYPPTQQSVKAYVDDNIVSGAVDTANSPQANDIARFTDANTIEGLTYAELRSAINIEDGADVTDATNVTAAGALMDSELADLAGVKALDTSTLQVKPAEGAFVNGDKTKLDGITAGADKAEYIIIAVSDETSDLEADTGVVTFRMPYAMTLSEVRASVNTAPVGSAIQVDINEGGASIMTTEITIDAGDKTSEDATTPPAINDTALAEDAEITIDIDAVGSSTAGKGLKVVLIGSR